MQVRVGGEVANEVRRQKAAGEIGPPLQVGAEDVHVAALAPQRQEARREVRRERIGVVHHQPARRVL